MALYGLFLFKKKNMENKISILESLFERVKSYTEISLELYKLKTLDKSKNVISTLVSRGIVVILFSVFIVTLNIGIALWLGDLLGKAYYGFFCIAGFYGIIGTIVYFLMHNYIKKRVSNSIITQVLN